MASTPPRPQRGGAGKGRPGGSPKPGGQRPSGPRRTETRTTAQQAAVVALLEPAVQATGLELEDVEIRSVGRRLVVRVLVDSETGVSLDEVAQASHTVSEALDASDVLGDEPYTLEVSSPGVDRPLTLPRHWRRSMGRLVAVTRRQAAAITGRVVAVTDTEVELETDVKGRTSRTVVPLADVARAVVQVEFNRKDDEALAALGEDVDGADDAADDDDTDVLEDEIDDEEED